MRWGVHGGGRSTLLVAALAGAASVSVAASAPVPSRSVSFCLDACEATENKVCDASTGITYLNSCHASCWSVSHTAGACPPAASGGSSSTSTTTTSSEPPFPVTSSTTHEPTTSTGADDGVIVRPDPEFVRQCQLSCLLDPSPVCANGMTFINPCYAICTGYTSYDAGTCPWSSSTSTTSTSEVPATRASGGVGGTDGASDSTTTTTTSTSTSTTSTSSTTSTPQPGGDGPVGAQTTVRPGREADGASGGSGSKSTGERNAVIGVGVTMLLFAGIAAAYVYSHSETKEEREARRSKTKAVADGFREGRVNIDTLHSGANPLGQAFLDEGRANFKLSLAGRKRTDGVEVQAFRKKNPLYSRWDTTGSTDSSVHAPHRPTIWIDTSDLPGGRAAPPSSAAAAGAPRRATKQLVEPPKLVDTLEHNGGVSSDDLDGWDPSTPVDYRAVALAQSERQRQAAARFHAVDAAGGAPADAQDQHRYESAARGAAYAYNAPGAYAAAPLSAEYAVPAGVDDAASTDWDGLSSVDGLSAVGGLDGVAVVGVQVPRPAAGRPGRPALSRGQPSIKVDAGKDDGAVC